MKLIYAAIVLACGFGSILLFGSYRRHDTAALRASEDTKAPPPDGHKNLSAALRASEDTKAPPPVGHKYLSAAAGAVYASRGVNTRIHVPAWTLTSAEPVQAHASSEIMESAMRASKSQSHESEWAMQQYFWGRRDGVVLELGGLDGITFSNSAAFETHLGWHAIMVEASPVSYAKLVVNRPNSLNVNLAVCGMPNTDAPPLLHYMTRYDGATMSGAVNGFWEFMSPDFRQRWFPGVTDANVDQPEPVGGTGSTRLLCGPLAPYLSIFGINHIDFWSLDVEGAELEVLRGVDFSQVTIDVIAIEAGANDDAKTEFLHAAGYERQRPKNPDAYPLYSARNVWYVRSEARSRLSSAPGLGVTEWE